MENTAFGSSEAASMGGNARAKALSVEQRREIARSAALSRWDKGGKQRVLRAIAEAPLRIGDIEFECAVLEGEIRVISERAFSRAIGAKRGGSHWIRRRLNPDGANLPVFLSAMNLRPFISMELAEALSAPISYIMESGQRAHGIRAELIPQILDVWLKARVANALKGTGQKQFAVIAEILVRGLAATGIIALIDEATGFQDHRAKDYLVRFLERYVAKEWRTYVRTFPVGFFKQICRLKGVPFREDMRRPQYFGHIVNDLVWDRLAPGLKDELRRVNPTEENGRRKRKHFQYLTNNIGHPKLLHHLGRIEGIAEGFGDGEYNAFYQRVSISLPSYKKAPLFAYFKNRE